MPPPPQRFHREGLPQDHVVSHCVCILRGGEAQGLPATRGPGCGFPPPAPWPTTPPPSLGPHQAAVVALGLQRVICGHEDGVGGGSLNLGHQTVVLGTGVREWHNRIITLSPDPGGRPAPSVPGEGHPDRELPSPPALTCSSSRKRWKAGTESSCCSRPCPAGTSLLGGSRTCNRAWGLVSMSLPLGLPRQPPAHPPPPYLAEDMQDTVGGKEVSHVQAGILHPDFLESSRQSSATVDTGRHARVGVAPTEAAGHTGTHRWPSAWSRHPQTQE